MRVLVVGGTGVVGRQLVPQLAAAGHDVVVTTTRSGLGVDGTRVGQAGPDRPSRGGHRRGRARRAGRHRPPGDSIDRPRNNLRRFDAALEVTNRLRTGGTATLLRAAEESGRAALRLMYGPGTSLDLGGRQIQAIKAIKAIKARQFPVVGGGGGVCSFTHVVDAASAVLAALRAGSGTYQVVDDEPAAVREWLPFVAGLAERAHRCACRPGSPG